MTSKTLKLNDLEKEKLGEVLQIVSTDQTALIVQLPNGEEVIIQPKQALKPLPILEGYIPGGWKEAIY